jgi:murein DD-endopeptidase MepM/ murein hydrolase activator NlpD
MLRHVPVKIIIFLAIFLVLGFTFQMPLSGGKLSSPYGPRLSADRIFHGGSDLSVPPGTPVRPVAPGTIRQASFTERNGNYIVIEHNSLMQSRYLHLDSISVNVGQHSDRDSIIGYSGNTGRSTGPHLHFEIRLAGVPLPAWTLCLPGLGIRWVVKKVGERI